MYSCNIAAMGIPYNVSVRPRNPAGCGLITNIVCFTIEGGEVHYSFDQENKIASVHCTLPITRACMQSLLLLLGRSTSHDL